MKPEFNYYYGQEAEQFTFYRIPKVLFTNDVFHNLSSDAKVLYGLMLDRMGLSIKNQWFDELNRVFIYFTLEDVQKHLNCGHNKGVKIMAELDSEKGIGLIERVKQGLGKPAKIYVKNFAVTRDHRIHQSSTANEASEAELSTEEVQTSEKRKSEVPIKGCLDFRKAEANKTNHSNTKLNERDISINPSYPRYQTSTLSEKNEIERWDGYRQLIIENIEYPYLVRRYGETATEILDVMVETVSTHRETIRISGEDFPAEVVRSQLMKLNSGHIEYVIDSMRNNTTKVFNIKAYLLATLYNSRLTMSHYYQAEVNHDMFGS